VFPVELELFFANHNYLQFYEPEMKNFYDHTSDFKWNPKRNSPTKSFVSILGLTILKTIK